MFADMTVIRTLWVHESISAGTLHGLHWHTNIHLIIRIKTWPYTWHISSISYSITKTIKIVNIWNRVPCVYPGPKTNRNSNISAQCLGTKAIWPYLLTLTTPAKIGPRLDYLHFQCTLICRPSTSFSKEVLLTHVIRAHPPGYLCP